MDESLSQETTPGRFARALRWTRTRRVGLICAALLSVMSIQMLAAAAHKSISTDEVVHIPAGYYHLVVGDFQFLNQHPPASMMIGALPLLFIQPGEMSEAERQQLPRDDAFVFVVSQRFWIP